MEANAFLSDCIEKEKKLNHLREDSKTNKQEIFDLVNSLRRDLKQFLSLHPQVVLKSKIDVHAILWKQCFYKQIEEYRLKIQKSMKVMQEGNAAYSASVLEKHQIHLASLGKSFQRFVFEASQYYQDFQLKVSYSD